MKAIDPHPVLVRLGEMGARPLLDRVCLSHGVPVSAVVGRDRGPTVSRARHELWSLLHGTWGLGLAEIGRLVERDHTTIMCALREREAEIAGPGVAKCRDARRGAVGGRR